MKLLCALIAIPALALQTAEPPKPEGSKKEKPSPKEKAHELLDGVAETAASAQPDVAAFALMYVAENYAQFDRLKAVEYMRQAFSIAGGMPPGPQKNSVLANVARATVQLSLPDALEMVRQVDAGNAESGHNQREGAINAIVQALTEKKSFDEAIELVNSLGAAGPYPFRALRTIFEKLPEGDPRREALFGYATSAYTLRPSDGFADLVAKHWKELPRAQAVAALGAIVENIKNAKHDPEPNYVSTLSSSRGAVTFTDPASLALFDVMYMVQEIDPEAAATLLDTRAQLKDAVRRFPQGRLSMGNNLNLSTSSGAGGNNAPARRLDALADSRAMEASRLVADESGQEVSAEVSKGKALKALEVAKTIPLPDRRARALGTIAKSVSKSDPSLAKTVLSECIDALKDVKDVSARQDVWDEVVVAAHRAGEDKLAWEAVDHSLEDAAELYKADTDAGAPNAAMRDQWPSTNAFRHSVIAATGAFGVDAEPLLQRVTDPDLAVFARVEMAATLLNNPRSNWTTSVSRAKR